MAAKRAPAPALRVDGARHDRCRDIDRYKAAKLREGVLGANQVNKTLGLLAQVLDAAGDYAYIDPARNPARGSRRRVKRTKPSRPTIEPEQLPSLRGAAGRLRPILAAMAGADCGMARHAPSTGPT